MQSTLCTKNLEYGVFHVKKYNYYHDFEKKEQRMFQKFKYLKGSEIILEGTKI